MARLALYLRLSLEDGGEGDESNSIGNQRKLLYEYIQHDPELARYEAAEFCDDGCSGTNMDRPAMQRLLREVKANQISCILVKDMSRFSRDYIEMGTYLNQIFPFLGIRFIAVNDHYDSREHCGGVIETDTAFRTLLYDLYSKDISVKVRASLANKCADGEYVFGQAPFGYEKSGEVKNTVIVNEREAEVVRYIFLLAVQGRTGTQIARQLYEEHIPTIAQMRHPERKYTDGRIHTWSTNAVRSILNNRFYLGEMAYGKTVRRSVGSKSGIAVPREEWKVIRNHHEALISEEIYEQAASRKQGDSAKKDSAKQNGEKHPLTGKLYCGGCGYSLSYKPQHGTNRYRRFECRKHALLRIPECCTYMSAALLEDTVFMMLQKELLLLGNAGKQKESLSFFQRAGVRSLKRKLAEGRREQKQLRAELDNLYEQYALKAIGREEYRERYGELTERLSSLSAEEADAAKKLAVLESEVRNAEADMEQMLRYAPMEELTREVVHAFIRKVTVYKGKRIEIEWNFSMGCDLKNS